MTNKPRASVWQILATYWKAMIRYPWVLSAVWISIILAMTTTVLAPIYYKDFFDLLDGAAPSDDLAGSLVRIVFIVLALNLATWLFWRLATFINNYYELRVAVDLKENSFDYLLKNSYRFFADNFGGSLVQKVNRLSRSFEAVLDNVNWTLLPLVARTVGITIVLWIYNPTIALILLALMAVFVLVNILLSRWKIKYDLAAS